MHQVVSLDGGRQSLPHVWYSSSQPALWAVSTSSSLRLGLYQLPPSHPAPVSHLPARKVGVWPGGPNTLGATGGAWPPSSRPQSPGGPRSPFGHYKIASAAAATISSANCLFSSMHLSGRKQTESAAYLGY